MSEKILTVKIDDREPLEKMIPMLTEAGFHCVVERLKAGDYIINDKIVFSLKSYIDFLGSVYNNHMHNEIGEMLLLPQKYWIGLIVWRWDDNKKFIRHLTRDNEIKVKQRVDKINTLYLPAKITKTRKTAVEYMYKWSLRSLDYEYPIQFRRNIELVGGSYPITVKMLAEIPDIGPKLAVKIHSVYPKIDLLIQDIKKTHFFDKKKYKTKKAWREQAWFTKIDLLGEKKANMIVRSLMFTKRK